MITPTTKLIAALAISASLLATNAAFAKGGSGKTGGGSGSGSNHSQSQISNSFKTFKLNSSSTNSSNHTNSISGISKKPITLSETFKKQDFNKDHKNSPLGISLNSMKKDSHKDLFCKKGDKCWWDPCYSKNFCYPYYFGCYYPLYSCYDYCTPRYTCSYSEPITLVENVGPARTPVAVGSVLMVNGQAFGPQPGGARLRVGGMAMPIEVLEWTPIGVKVRLPQVEIVGSTPAEIEVLRVDGSLAAKSPIDLIPAGQFAFGR